MLEVLIALSQNCLGVNYKIYCMGRSINLLQFWGNIVIFLSHGIYYIVIMFHGLIRRHIACKKAHCPQVQLESIRRGWNVEEGLFILNSVIRGRPIRYIDRLQ